MANVTFDPAVGGDGSVVSDDASPTTGLAAGGFRTRLVPALAQLVAIANFVKTKATEAAAAVVAKNEAVAARDVTISARDAALAALQTAAVMEDYGLITEAVTASNDWGTMV